MFYKNEALAIIIDGASIHSASQSVDLQIDWHTFLTEFQNRGHLIRAIYATPIFEDEGEHNPLRPLIDWLDYNGFTTITRTARKEADDNGRFRIKNGNIHVDVTLAAIRLAKKADHIVLFSGDGSYEPLVKELKRMNVRVSVCCAKKSAADGLRRNADEFIDLEDIRGLVGRAT